MIWLVVLSTVVAAVTVWWCAVPKVRVDDPEAPHFADLVTARSTLGLGIATALLSGVLWLVPALHLWLWVPYVAFGAPLVAVDLRTTFLPKRLNALAAMALLPGGAVLAVLEPTAALGALFGAGGAFLLFYLAWRVSASLGFGDVRLAILIGAVSGQAGVAAWSTSLFLGTALGAIHGICHGLWARRSEERPQYFPFGPALWLGPLATCALAVTAG